MSAKRTKPALFIGPYSGEFGVEVLRWQGVARTLAQSRRWREIIVCGHPEREFLYRDFCTRYVPFVAPSEHALGLRCLGLHAENVHEQFIDLEKGDVLLSPKFKPIQRMFLYGQSACRSTFRNFSKGTFKPKSTFDILIHARATLKAGQFFKNWPVSSWEEFLRQIPREWRVASIGSRRGAHKIRGTVDLRDIPLESLAAHCAAAKMVVGPSSGAIHFAMHCGTGAVTWIDHDLDQSRPIDHPRCNYFPQWNPFDAPLVCLTGWQPTARLVAMKTRELATMIASAKDAVAYAVFGTKRSGHHGVIEWIVGCDHRTRLTHWNDCVAQGFETYPPEDFTVQTRRAAPKMLHQADLAPAIHLWNQTRKKRKRILSFEGLPIEKIRSLPEAQAAERLVFVLRDGLNLAASLRKGIPQLSKKSFLDAEFRSLFEVYRGYLFEAVGETDHLRELRGKTVFISYNRWHMEPTYRAEIAATLTGTPGSSRPGTVSAYAHESGFQEKETAAADLRTLSRWQHYYSSAGLWNLCCDDRTYQAEQKFHGAHNPMGLRFPTTEPDGIPFLPAWALRGWPSPEEAGLEV